MNIFFYSFKFFFFFFRLYFFGGEKRWRVSWFDIEKNIWGESEGVPPPRLLSGTAAVQDLVYLIGTQIHHLTKGQREGGFSKKHVIHSSHFSIG